MKFFKSILGNSQRQDAGHRSGGEGASLNVEGLESREMLDATSVLADGVLRIEGTSGRDVINVDLSQDGNRILVRSGASVQAYGVADVSEISISAGAGNDHVTIAPDVMIDAVLIGGEGNDVLNAGGGSAIIDGGDGNDVLVGGPKADRIEGDAGKDKLFGNGGDDTLFGGSGPDKLYGGKGDDQLSGGSGNDVVLGGHGHDELFGHGGNGGLQASGFSLDLNGNGQTTSSNSVANNDKLDGNEGNNTVVNAAGDIQANSLVPVPQGFNFANTANLAQLGFDGLESIQTLAAAEVQTILDRASAATASNDAIITVVDRNGRLLGVRVEDGVSAQITGNADNLFFAIDGALAKARTGAFFGNNGAPLTSRTIQFISQTTILEREVESNPNIADPNSRLRGPGFVAPIGVGGHFPPIPQVPSANLFAIEHTNRDSLQHPGIDGIKNNGNDVLLTNRFNINQFAPGAMLFAPESSGGFTRQARGIGTLPGGIPIYKLGAVPGFPNPIPQIVGGIGVFFPGDTGFANEENSILSADFDPTRPDRSLEAEYIAFTAIGGSSLAGQSFAGPIGNAPALPGFDIPFGRIDVDGIKVPIFGPLVGGADALVAFGQSLGVGTVNGANQPFFDTNNVLVAGPLDGRVADDGWIVDPTDSAVDAALTADVVQQIIHQAIVQAINTRAAIRLRISNPALTNQEDLRPNASASMVFAVSDTAGNVLGLYRMPDATIFSIDVAVAKSRNTGYYADANNFNPLDQIDDNNDGVADVQPGTALTNRTFRYLALPFFPSGIDGTIPGDFSILRAGQTLNDSALNNVAPLPANVFDNTILGRDAFRPGTNFRDDAAAAGNTNGIVFFPGSVPIYVDLDGDGINETLVGGFGVSGDGVDQDDVVTFSGSQIVVAPQNLRVDMPINQVRNINLPYQKFNRNPSHLEK